MKKNIKTMLVSITAMFVICLSFAINGFNTIGIAKAAALESSEKTYSSVTADLARDSTFSISDYPELDSVEKREDKLQVIAMAESVDRELFLYIYCPLVQQSQLIASKMAVTFSSDSGSNFLYHLAFLNAQNTLFKYRVKDYTVSTETTRLYNIKTLWVNDDATGFSVDKVWTFKTVGDNNSCSVDKGKTYNIGVLGSSADTGVPIKPKDDGNIQPTETAKTGITAILSVVTVTLLVFSVYMLFSTKKFKLNKKHISLNIKNKMTSIKKSFLDLFKKKQRKQIVLKTKKSPSKAKTKSIKKTSVCLKNNKPVRNVYSSFNSVKRRV